MPLIVVLGRLGLSLYRIQLSILNNLYWRIRNARGRERSKIRTYYRLVAAEKKRLIDSGVDGELVRLYCRYLANPHNPFAKRALDNYVRLRKLEF